MRENTILRHSRAERPPVQFIGKSAAVRDVTFLINKVAPARIPVLITGESGAGKDVVARLIHEGSACAGQPMIVKNCASLQKELARSELFGHVKGSFTGATESREGLMAYAHDSTLFVCPAWRANPACGTQASPRPGGRQSESQGRCW
jgi:two-component system NtrC family response regulator